MALPDSSDTPATTNGSPGGAGEWPVQATDTIVRVVDSVRDKTTGPALNVARWLIYGLVLTLLAIPVIVLALVGTIYLLEGLLLWVHDTWSWAAFLHDPIWVVYEFLGVTFVLSALVCWHKGKTPAPA